MRMHSEQVDDVKTADLHKARLNAGIPALEPAQRGWKNGGVLHPKTEPTVHDFGGDDPEGPMAAGNKLKQILSE